MDVAITIMGDFAVTVGNTVVDQTEWRRRQAAALVKVLALATRRRLHREQVMDLLWSELDVDEAAPRLHKAAHYARRALRVPGSLVLAGDSVALFPQQDIRIDAREFQALADFALSRRDPVAAARAADAYGGELLPQDRYEPWVQDTRDQLHLLYLDVLRLSGRWEALTTVDPTDEEAHLRVITQLASRGERRAALRQFERLERALRQELGVAPSPAAVRLRADLRVAGAAEAEQLSNAIGSPSAASTLALVGGAEDRTRLDRLLDTVTSGHGQALFVAGRAGIGKTALLAWLERAATERGLRVGTGVAAQIEGAWPYAPVLEALADPVPAPSRVARRPR